MRDKSRKERVSAILRGSLRASDNAVRDRPIYNFFGPVTFNIGGAAARSPLSLADDPLGCGVEPWDELRRRFGGR